MPSLFKHPRAALATAVASAALLGAGTATAVAVGLDDGSSVVREVTVTSGRSAASSTTTVGAVYKAAAKSVVEITVNGQTETTPFGGGGTQQAQGSGFVFDDQGHIVTNQHVVDGAQSISVTFSNGKSYDATVVGTDSSTDLAVLKVDAPTSLLSPLALADSSELEVGDGVIAIGSPFGLDQTVTTGIVSALHREITAPNNFAIDDAIQTDAAINHGNSGGPLLDLEGKVVGVNSQIESESGGNDGIGFAVPSNTVAKVAATLISDGSIEHAYLGVSTEDAQGSSGAAIADVGADTPAAAAGLQSGDVVIELDGRSVDSADELRSLIDSKSPGDELELTITRDGSTTTVQVTLGTRPS
jgi:putative serine protease PepD